MLLGASGASVAHLDPLVERLARSPSRIGRGSPIGRVVSLAGYAALSAEERAVPKGTLELVDGAGHALSWEDFDGTAASVERFLAK